jgi:hypothetical protein
MKIFTLFVVCFSICSAVAFAENLPEDASKSSKDTGSTNMSGYKSSPRLHYHSNKQENDDPLKTIGPMLNQVIGNNPKDSTGSAEMPGSAKYNF